MVAMVGDADVERELMVQTWARKLKEVAGDDCVLELATLEETCARCYDAYQSALLGDNGEIARFVKDVAVARVRQDFTIGSVMRALWTFRGVAVDHNWSQAELLRLDSVICYATGTFAELCHDASSETGYLSVIEALAVALESKDEYTSSHCNVVQCMSEVIAKDLGVEIGRTGLFHDLGKLHVPDHILNKPGKLSPEEYEVVKQHSLHAYRMLMPLPPPLPSLVLQHHERPDGLGYPLGLTDVPMPSAVVAVADTLHAIVSDRPFRAAQPFEAAVEIINQAKGTQLRVEPVEAFNRVKDALREIELGVN